MAMASRSRIFGGTWVIDPNLNAFWLLNDSSNNCFTHELAGLRVEEYASGNFRTGKTELFNLSLGGHSLQFLH
jgi:hypothetical protein